MSDENEYAGSGHFVGESESEAPKASKKSSVADRQIVKNNGAAVADAKDVSHTAVGQQAVQTSEAMGNPNPPIGPVVEGVAGQLSPYLIGAGAMLGLKKAWDILSSPQGQTSNDGAKGSWGKTIAGKPENAKLGEAPVAPTAEPVAPPVAAPEAVPNTSTAAPVVQGAVEPKPLSELEQLRVDKAKFELEAAKAKEARAAELHANKLASEAKRAETKVQQGQGKAFNNQDNTILANAEKIKAEKALEAAGLKKPPKQAPAASVAPPAQTTPITATPTAPAPQSVTPPADKFVLPISSNPAETALTKEQMSARNWLSSQYGSPSKYFESVQDIHGGVPPSYTSAAGEKAIGKDAHQVIMDWRKTNIEGPKVNLTHDMKKVMKGAGGMAVLMALPGFAEAAQRKDVGKMSDIFTDFFVLPFAQSREAGIPKAQEESTIASKFKEAQKLGSPYASVPPPKR